MFLWHMLLLCACMHRKFFGIVYSVNYFDTVQNLELAHKQLSKGSRGFSNVL